jgi:hypothetical protein
MNSKNTLFNGKKQYQNSISKFNIKKQYQKTISKFNIKIQYQNSISKFNINNNEKIKFIGAENKKIRRFLINYLI